jgi:hypothetical protein
MIRSLKVWIFPAACCFLLLPWTAHGQQNSEPPPQQQGISSSPPSFQSSKPPDSSQKPPPSESRQLIPIDDQSPPPRGNTQPPQETHQSGLPAVQESPPPSVQYEIPAVWPPPQPLPSLASAPGYMGIRIRDFYRERFCMHALTIQGVEVASVEPNSPAARAGLRPARGLSTREVAVATIAGLLTISPASSLAPAVTRAAGGVGHGDIILAVGGKRVKTETQFQEELSRFGPRTVVHLTIRRGDAVVQVPVQLDDWPAQFSSLPSQPVHTQLRN